MPYATLDDVFNLGLSAQAFVVRARPFDAVDITTGTIRLTAHGFSAADSLLFVAVSGGALPPELSGFTYYTPKPLGADLFQVLSPSNGIVIAPFSSAGSGWSIGIDLSRRLQAHLEETAATIDEHLTAHDPPILPDPNTGKLPQILVGLNARMAARQMVTSLQFDNAAFRVATDRLFAREAADQIILNDWKNGKPLQPRPTDQDNILDNSAHASTSRASVGWTTGQL
jgi:hypothetical protein